MHLWVKWIASNVITCEKLSLPTLLVWMVSHDLCFYRIWVIHNPVMNSLNQFNQLYSILWMYSFIDWKTLLKMDLFILMHVLFAIYSYRKSIPIQVNHINYALIKGYKGESMLDCRLTHLFHCFINPFMFRCQFQNNFHQFILRILKTQ